MKSAVIVVILLTGAAFIWNAVQPATPTFVLRYRLTLEIDTPNGLRQGSSVIETAVYISKGKALLSEASGDRVETTGEAVFVDLGENKNVIALLTGGPKGDWADWHRYFLLGAFSHARQKDVKLSELSTISGTAIVDEATELRGSPLIPTIMTFTDTTDPASAKILRWKQDYTQSFGAGFGFRRAKVEVVPNTTPITRGIEQRLPWWNGSFPWLKQSSPGSMIYVDTRTDDQFRWNKEQFRRNF
jgi:hypothetical protein